MKIKNKKICFFNSCIAWGGGEKWYRDTAIQLSQRKYKIIFLANQKSELYGKMKNEKVDLYHMNVSNLSFLNIKKIIKLIGIFKSENIDTVILNLPSDLKLAGIASKLAGVRKVVYRRGSAIPINNTILNKFLLKNCVTDIVANSETTKKTLLKNTSKWLNEEKIKVIYNGINLEEINEKKWSPVYQRKGNEIILGNAGRLNKQKGQKYLIDIAVELQKRNLEFKILIAGTGDLEDKLKQYAKERKVSNNVIFLGFVENIKSFMMSIDVFLLTSLWEGFGYVMVEAMASKKVVMAFDVSNVSEIITENKTGYLIEDFNIKEMCNKIEKINKNSTLLEKMGREGKNTVAARFDIKIAIDILESFLKR